MRIQNFGLMFLFMLISSFTPGPGNLLALDTMIKSGWKDGRKLILGIVSGYLTVQYICTFAVFELNHYLSSALHVLKFVGAAYLVWLAIHVIISKSSKNKKQRNPHF